MLEIALTVTLTFGGGSWHAHLNPHVIFDVPAQVVSIPFVPGFDYWCGMALPYVAFASTDCLPGHPDLVDHERGHLRQWSAWGPGVLAVSLLSRGQAVESYLGEAYDPSPAEAQLCPLLTLSSEGPATFAPCWRL